MSPESDFPLFPLGIVALPTEAVPLHIFEERYLTMISECLATGGEFGIVWADDDSVQTIGCAMEIAAVLDGEDENSMNIACRGTRPFSVLETVDALPYPAGTIEFLADDPEDPDESRADETRSVYSDLVRRVTDGAPDPDELSTMSAYAMAARIDFGPAAKQGLLALRSENARLQLVAQLIRAVLKRLDFTEIAQERSRSNGKVRFG